MMKKNRITSFLAGIGLLLGLGLLSADAQCRTSYSGSAHSSYNSSPVYYAPTSYVSTGRKKSYRQTSRTTYRKASVRPSRVVRAPRVTYVKPRKKVRRPVTRRAPVRRY